MNRIRRTAVLLAGAAAVLFGSVLPADAQFSNSASTPTMPIRTVDVTAPGNVSTGGPSATRPTTPRPAPGRRR